MTRQRRIFRTAGEKPQIPRESACKFPAVPRVNADACAADDVEGIPKHKVFVDGYTNFQRDMVYGEKTDFATTMATVKEIAEHLKEVPG